jgi:glycolate oxidase FAD binding subunit
VALPWDEEGVSRVLAVAWESGLGVVPWGGGSHQALGRGPTRYDVALDLRRLNGVLAYEPADMTATVRAGTRLADLQARLGLAGQFWPLDPPLEDRATIGGVVAAGLGGPLRCRYGAVRDLVLGVRVAHADGTVTKAGARVVKNATAYNLTRLYTGSHGTLGVLLEVTIRVQPRPAVEQGWWLTGGTTDRCQAAALRILGSHLAPTRVELLDRAAAEAAGKPDGGPGLAVSVAGAKASVEEQGMALAALASGLGLDIAHIATPERTWGAIRDFPWGAADRGGPEVSARWRGSVLPSECAGGLDAVSRAGGRFGEVSAAATVSHGALRGTLRAPSVGRLADGLAAAREALAALGGLLVVTGAPTTVAAGMDVWGPPPPEMDIMRRIKTAFDGKGILNPGRFVDGI